MNKDFILQNKVNVNPEVSQNLQTNKRVPHILTTAVVWCVWVQRRYRPQYELVSVCLQWHQLNNVLQYFSGSLKERLSFP